VLRTRSTQGAACSASQPYSQPSCAVGRNKVAFLQGPDESPGAADGIERILEAVLLCRDVDGNATSRPAPVSGAAAPLGPTSKQALEVSVVAAIGLHAPAASDTFVRVSLLSDYAEVIQSNDQSFDTYVVKGTQNPKWRQDSQPTGSFARVFGIEDYWGASLRCSVFTSKRKELGTCVISLHEWDPAFDSRKSQKDCWYPLYSTQHSSAPHRRHSLSSSRSKHGRSPSPAPLASAHQPPGASSDQHRGSSTRANASLLSSVVGRVRVQLRRASLTALPGHNAPATTTGAMAPGAAVEQGVSTTSAGPDGYDLDEQGDSVLRPRFVNA